MKAGQRESRLGTSSPKYHAHEADDPYLQQRIVFGFDSKLGDQERQHDEDAETYRREVAVEVAVVDGSIKENVLAFAAKSYLGTPSTQQDSRQPWNQTNGRGAAGTKLRLLETRVRNESQRIKVNVEAW